MNYLAHGRNSLGDAWLLAGTALPDWLRMLDRSLRIQGDRATEVSTDADPRAAALARGVLRHLADDAAFHAAPAFLDATRRVADLLRPLEATLPRLRPSFVAHIVIEVLLDAEIVRADAGALDAYYGTLATLDPADVERIAARLTPAPPAGLARLVRGFIDARFVGEYLDDARVAHRVDQVFRRVGTERLGPELAPILPAARTIVAAVAPGLLGRVGGRS